LLKAGDAFLAKLPDGSYKFHLCLLLTDEGGMGSTAFIVPVMTPQPHSDPTTIVPTSECPDFLIYDSYVSYAHLVEQDAQTFEPKIVRSYPPISADCLKRAIGGAFRSKVTPRGVRHQLKDRLAEQL